MENSTNQKMAPSVYVVGFSDSQVDMSITSSNTDMTSLTEPEGVHASVINIQTTQAGPVHEGMWEDDESRKCNASVEIESSWEVDMVPLVYKGFHILLKFNQQ